MKKIFSFFILLILVNLAAKAQQEPLFSNYMLFRPVANPSFVGADKTINAIFVNRTMFAGFGEGKPVTSVFGVEAPVEIFGIRSGLGIVIISDEVGFNRDINVQASYAYHHSLENGTLGGGFNIGVNNYSITPNWSFPEDGVENLGYWDESDPFVPDQLSTINVGIGLGAYYETPQYYLGFSVSKLNRAVVETKEGEINEIAYYAPHYYLTGAYNIELPDPLFDLQPSFMLRSDLSATMLDLNGTLYYKSKYWAGFGLRASIHNLAALTFLGGIELANGLNVGYALDINTGSMILGGATSHEVLVSYSFNLDTKRNQKYKSIRYL